MKFVKTTVWLAMMAGAMGIAVTAAAQASVPDAPAPQQPASQTPANEVPAKQNPGNQGGCYVPDASGKQVFVPNCGLTEAPQRKQPAQGQTPPQTTAPASGASAAQANPFPGEDNDAPVVKQDGSIVPAGSAGTGGLKDAGSSGDSSTSSSSSSSSSSDSGLSGLPDDPNTKGPLADDDTVIKKPRKKLPPVIAQTDAERVAEDLSVFGFYMDDSNYRGAYLRATDAVTHAPDDPNAHFALAEVARKLGKLDEALAQYKKTLELDPIPKDKKAAEKAVKEMSGKG